MSQLRSPVRSIVAIAVTAGLAVAMLVLGGPGSMNRTVPEAAAASGTFYNPVADVYDPTIVTHDGDYYLIGTSETRHLQIRTSSTVAGLRAAEPVTVWSGPSSGIGCCLLWSPVLQKVQGTWYIYLSVTDAASPGAVTEAAVYALQSTTGDPLGPYTLKDTLKTWEQGQDPGPWEKGIVGPSVTEMPDGRLFFTSTTFGFYVQPMSNPWTLEPGSSMVTIDDGSPDHAWEGGTSEIARPFVHTQNGQTKVFVPYSSENHVTHRTNGGPCWSWCVGMFTNTDGNLLDPASWEKSAQPEFAGGPDSGLYRVLAVGTFSSPDGSENWMVYNASDSPGTDFGERDTFIQPFSYDADGEPDFGSPVPVHEAIPVPSGESGSPPPVVPGSTLADEDFTSGAGKWDVLTGSWAPCSGEYCSTGTGDNLTVIGEPRWADYTIQAKVTADNAPNGSGVNVVARAESASALYNLELLKDASGTLKWVIARNRSGSWQVLDSGPYQWSPGTTYWLRLDVNAGKLTGLISTDGTDFRQLGVVRLAGMTERAGDGDFGRAGLRTWGGLTASFDDVTVRANRPSWGFYSGRGWPGLTVDAGASHARDFCVNDYNEYCLGGEVNSTTSSISTSGVAGALPASYYQTERWGDTLVPKYPGDDGSFRYVVPSLQPGASYTVRLHFAEIHFTEPGQRTFDVAVNGTVVLDELDKVAAAGGSYRALVREFTATADEHGHIMLEFLPGTRADVADHNPTVSAIEVATP
ncbi:GH43 family beta-xylosidase [Haloactinopolyspora alba]|uniref:GH43 family beta-xylosidase n=1 Tax=Haloactinopolyspora alba TaxID=648780 RepID=A0A2P8DY76_9ACTN|nr:family 43 glycosylhydrolase [Haloactinopolyspora alba]PSL02176.1 GH43 family beta-xylosidase [Haloactinopolyspora alba]